MFNENSHWFHTIGNVLLLAIFTLTIGTICSMANEANCQYCRENWARTNLLKSQNYLAQHNFSKQKTAECINRCTRCEIDRVTALDAVPELVAVA